MYSDVYYANQYFMNQQISFVDDARHYTIDLCRARRDLRGRIWSLFKISYIALGIDPVSFSVV